MKPTRILDGGMSRELVRLGAELRQPEWSALALIENPAIVRRVHEEFLLPAPTLSPPTATRLYRSTSARNGSA